MLETQSLDPEIISSRAKLSRNVTVSILTNVLYLLTRLFIPPFILSYVSLSEYGLWAYCFILISYLGMSVFGVTNVYVRYIAVYNAKKDQKSINRLLSTGLFSVSLLCLLLLPLIWWALPWVISAFRIEGRLAPMAFTLFFGTALIFMIDLTIGIFGHILQSLQQIAKERMIWTLSYLVETALIVIFLANGMGIYGLLYAFFVRTAVAVLFYAIASYRAMPGLSIRPSHFDTTMLPLFYRFGGVVQLSGIFGVVNRSIEKVFAGFFLGTAITGLYEVGEKFAVMALMIPGSVNAAFLPTASHLHANGKKEEIAKIFLNGSRFVNILTGTIMGFFAAFAFPIIACWLGPDPKYHFAAVILMFFTIAYQMDVLTGPASAIYRSIEKPVKELYYGASQLLLVILLAVLVFPLYGVSIMSINGVVVAGMVATALAYLAYSSLFLEVKLHHFFVKALFPGLLPYLVAFFLFFFSAGFFMQAEGRGEIFGKLLILFAIYAAVMAVLTLFVICDRTERAALRKLVGLK